MNLERVSTILVKNRREEKIVDDAVLLYSLNVNFFLPSSCRRNSTKKIFSVFQIELL
jgi:hypothetical protein